MHAIDCSLSSDVISGETKRAQDSGSLDKQDKEGLTALHYAVLNENIEAAKIVIEFGADKTLETNDGETAADLAEEDDMKSLFT